MVTRRCATKAEQVLLSSSSSRSSVCNINRRERERERRERETENKQNWVGEEMHREYGMPAKFLNKLFYLEHYPKLTLTRDSLCSVQRIKKEDTGREIRIFLRHFASEGILSFFRHSYQ